MTRHGRYVNIDPDNPASLSKKVIDIIRECGFDGFMLTDALIMMGVVARFGKRDPIGMCIASGNDMSLPYTSDNEFAFKAACECYDEGMIPDDRLDEAVKRILAAQHKAMAEPKYSELTEKDKADFARINTDSVYARTDDGIPTALSRDGNHLFLVMCEEKLDINNLSVDTFSDTWYRPNEIVDKIKEHFPNSEISFITEYPSPADLCRAVENAPKYDDVVFVSYFNSRAYVGIEAYTPRILSLIHALQGSNSISTILHFGNPYILEPLPHISRVIIGTMSADNIRACFDVLAGLYPVKGVLSYNIKLQ